MNYPLISEYIEAIKAAEDNFDELSFLRPVLDADGQPVMTNGNFAVVFKMQDERDGKLYAVKCFTKEQEGREEAYKQIADELEYVSSNYLIRIRYYENELFVDTDNSEEEEFSVLLMDWVEGETLDVYIKEHANEKYILEMLSFQFCKMSSWLLSQPFAHGDLKPDNILVKENGQLVLVDYDGMYVPAMKGQHAREMGSPGFRHPKRTDDSFGENLDDFSIALIAMSLKAFSISPKLIDEYCNNDTFFFTEKDFVHIHSTKAMNTILELTGNEELCSLYGAFMIALAKVDLSLISSRLLELKNPKIDASYAKFIYNKARNLCKETKDKSKIDHNKAFELFQKAAKLGNPEAQCCMGCCFKNGYGTQVDYFKAREWYDISSSNGCARALRHIGFCYQSGIGEEKDVNKAIECYDKAIDLGDISAMVTKGAIYYYGREGMPINYEEAVKWYKKAAEMGDDSGMWRLAVCYMFGIGIEKNIDVAFKWFEKSARKNNPNGQYGLGLCFYNGSGVEQNYGEAVKLFKKAATKEQAGSLWRLGHCYEYGLGVAKDLTQAFEWYKKSADKGTSEGQWRLGRCYENGIGAQMNLAEAKSLYVQAARSGHKKAIEALKRMESDELPF